MIVVSEIGEQWSPHTAPAIHAEIAMMQISLLIEPPNTARTMGIRIPNVPHDVPVENERPTPMRKTIAGSNGINSLALVLTNSAMNILAPRLSVIVLSVHAQQRIMIAGTIALKPSGSDSMQLLNVRTRLQRK